MTISGCRMLTMQHPRLNVGLLRAVKASPTITAVQVQKKLVALG